MSSIGGSCGTAAGDIATVSVTINGVAASPSSATCSSGSWTLTLTTALSAQNTYSIVASQSDQAGNTGTNTQSVIIDTTAPTVTGVSTTTSSGYYNATKVIAVTVTFSEPVNVTGTPKLTLNTSPSETANYASGSGTSTLTFNYTVVAGDNSSRLDYTSTSALALNSGTIKDAATNAAVLTLPAVAGGNDGLYAANIVIDTTAPSVALTQVNGSTRSFPYSTNQNVSSIGGSCGTAAGDIATVSVTINGVAASPSSATCSSGSWTLTLTTALSAQNTYSIVASQSDQAGNTGTNTQSVIIDTTAPSVALTQVNGSTRSFPYSTNQNVSSIGGSCGTAAGDIATVSVTINGVAASPSSATCSSGSWTLTLTTALSAQNTYSIVASQSDQAGNTGTNTQSVIIDTTAPTVTGVSTTTSSGYYNATKVIAVTVTFSEPVNVTGTPKLTLNTSPSETANYASGSGTSTLTFNYTVVAGDNSSRLDYTSTSALALNSGTIKDAATNAAVLTLPAVAGGNDGLYAANIVIDTTAPTASAIATTPNPKDGIPDASDVISYTYSEVMSPSSILSGWNGTGSQNVYAHFSRASGSDTQLAICESLSSPATSCSTSVNLGTLDLGDSSRYMPSGDTINLNATISMATVSGKSVVTVTLGTQYSTVGTGAVFTSQTGTMTIAWTPSVSATDLAGNACSNTAKNESSAAENF